MDVDRTGYLSKALHMAAVLPSAPDGLFRLPQTAEDYNYMHSACLTRSQLPLPKLEISHCNHHKDICAPHWIIISDMVLCA